MLGALLGDGCLYRYKITQHRVILIGDKNFTTKYSDQLFLCTNKKDKAYINRSKNIWFVNSNNFKLFSLFQKTRHNINYLEKLIKENGKEASILFVEGFFDAEGCVKIIKEKIRKTPKICLDITNTNYDYLEIIKNILKDIFKIEARYSTQKAYIGKDGFQRKTCYHLRIYKKEYVKIFIENIHTTKLKDKKVFHVKK